jgi:dihydrofolate synthase / folylpolyglutamate synthase
MASSDALIARFMALHPKVIDLSLDRILELLSKLGNPQDRLPPVIHVAGTNGKGSTIAFMRAILEAAGLNVHVYTSPHLVHFHERIRLARPGGGRLVEEELLIDALAHCERVNAGKPITMFEITTAAAFLLFSQHPADVLLLEVGLGGRLDATNVITHPFLSVITSIGYDHADYLGDTIEQIAAEKAGIFKRGSMAIIAPQDYRQAEDVLYQKAQEARIARLMVGGQDFTAHAENGRLVYQDEEGLLDLPLPRLMGRHQITNAGAAIAAVRTLNIAPLQTSHIEAGLNHVEWFGRLQRLKQGHFVAIVPKEAEIWLDGGHNKDGGRMLAAAMADMEERHDAPLILIIGMLATKDSEGFLKNFTGLAKEVIGVPIPGQMASRPAEDIAQMAIEAGLIATTQGSVEAALSYLSERKFKHPPRILICGSLYLIGSILAANGILPN